MKITILGGGITGLTAAYVLQQKGHLTTILEKENELGGLASGFKEEGWEWPVERSYHHIFSNDSDILGFSREIGYEGFEFSEPQTSSLYKVGNNYRTFTVDTPQDFLSFPLLSLPVKIRAGAVLAFLKVSPFFSFFERKKAAEFLRETMGEQAWKVLWQELFRKKFGNNAENILTSFIWARIKKRTKKLGYPQGGFPGFIDHLHMKASALGVKVERGRRVQEVRKANNTYQVALGGGEVIESDIVISTLPTPILIRVAKDIFPTSYIRSLEKISYSHAVGFVLSAEEPLFEREYWVSVCDSEAPMMVLVQHTNLVDKKHFGGEHILYIGNYVDEKDPFYKEDGDTILAKHLSYLKKIKKEDLKIRTMHFFRMPFAQPLFDLDFPKHMPRFETPAKGFYIANLDMTYPFDRGTNYAVKLGRQVVSMI